MRSASITAIACLAALSASSETYSPFAGEVHPQRVFWGDTHLHTTNSPDAYLFGVRLSPDDAFDFAKGERVTATHGLPVRLERPLDFLVVSDHAEYLGLVPRLFAGDEKVTSTEYGAELYESAQRDGQMEAAMRLVVDLANNREKMKLPGLAVSIWEDVAATADRHDDPGVFTAFIGYEWTSMIRGNNLHRVVIYRDGADRAARLVPVSSFESVDPENLWDFLQKYEDTTGGDVFAIPHNSNLSNGMMFQTKRIERGGLSKRFTREYAATRLRWEPLVEVTQIKGDSEAHPLLSPNDEFADFENWDHGNLDLSEEKKDSMLAGEYIREALKRGLDQERRLGVNPFQFGLIGSTDSHTGLATAREDNFWGKHSLLEPNPERLATPVGGVDEKRVEGWEQVASGLAAVWATENTRAAIFDAMERRETYATTGPRMTVRVFGGWDFEAGDLARPDFLPNAYARGVPMGGELSAPPASAAGPRFLVNALRDPAGANLDRIQIVKGWQDETGELHEQVYDVALSDGRSVGADGAAPAVGSTVDVASASYTNTIGEATLQAWWEDPDFHAEQRAFYYVRVLQIPTPRWTAYDAMRFGVSAPAESPMTVQDRAYTSPIWYSPEGS
jgi:hypothetical protein